MRADGPGAPVTITAYPGEVPQVEGWMNLNGAYLTVSRLVIDGSNTFYRTHPAETSNCRAPISQSLEINGEGDVFEHNEYFQSVPRLRGVGIGIGYGGPADDVVIRNNKIHDTGQCDNHDHSIYVAHGDNARIYDNWMWHNHGGQALIVYPGTTNARIFNNVIDSSDSGFSLGDNGSGSQVAHNWFYHNVVSNSGTVVNPLAGFSFGGLLINCGFASSGSTGNAVQDNDSHNNPGGVQQGCSGGSHVRVANTARSRPPLRRPGWAQLRSHEQQPARQLGPLGRTVTGTSRSVGSPPIGL